MLTNHGKQYLQKLLSHKLVHILTVLKSCVDLFKVQKMLLNRKHIWMN